MAVGVAFVATKYISPLPCAGAPMEVLLFVQRYSVPLTTDPVKLMILSVLLQAVWLPGLNILGVGFTVAKTGMTGLLQPAAVSR